MLCCIVLYCIVSNIVSYHIILYYIILYYLMPCHITSPALHLPPPFLSFLSFPFLSFVSVSISSSVAACTYTAAVRTQLQYVQSGWVKYSTVESIGAAWSEYSRMNCSTVTAVAIKASYQILLSNPLIKSSYSYRSIEVKCMLHIMLYIMLYNRLLLFCHFESSAPRQHHHLVIVSLI